ncbi:MAG: FecCD family ABC transporter permease [Gulosibacter sp.]|uniref:FecCD family ABC transporter permease n=1 Tax=Gulosibacter sp. TaxID=2817531 RepID=UPI003F8E3D8A
MTRTLELNRPVRASRTGRFAATVAVLALCLVASIILAALFGAVTLPLDTFDTAVTTPPHLWDSNQIILMQVRIPRVLTAAIVGAGLAISGVALQTTLRNPLAEPYLLGISSGASLGAVSVILLGVGLMLPVAALLGGTLALLATLILSGARTRMPAERVILGGVAVTALFSALTSLVIFRSPDSDSYQQVLHWLLGSLASSSWQSVSIAGAAFAIFGTVIFCFSRLLSLFLLNDDEVASLGINTRQARAGVLTVAAMLAAGMVSVSGAIGFVGLIVPHLARPLARGSVIRHLVSATLIGAILLVWSDTFSRLIALPEELPVGITTSVLGAIAFAIIMIRQRGNHA